MIRAQVGDPAKQKTEHHRGEQRLDDEPRRTEDGLLVLRSEVALRHQPHKVAVSPKLAPRDVEQTTARKDGFCPVCFGHSEWKRPLLVPAPATEGTKKSRLIYTAKAPTVSLHAAQVLQVTSCLRNAIRHEADPSQSYVFFAVLEI